MIVTDDSQFTHATGRPPKGAPRVPRRHRLATAARLGSGSQPRRLAADDGSYTMEFQRCHCFDGPLVGLTMVRWVC